MKYSLLLLTVLLTLANYTAEYSEKKLVWIGFDMGWGALRMVIILGSSLVLFVFIYLLLAKFLK